MELVTRAILHPTHKFTEDEREQVITKYLDHFPSDDSSEILDKLTERDMAERILQKGNKNRKRKRVQDIAREYKSRKKVDDTELRRKTLTINRERLPGGSEKLYCGTKTILLNEKDIDADKFYVKIHNTQHKEMLENEVLPKMTLLTSTKSMRRAVVRVLGAHELASPDVIEVSRVVWDKLDKQNRAILSMYAEAPEIGTVYVNESSEEFSENLAGLSRGELLGEKIMVTKLLDTEDKEIFEGVFSGVGTSEIKVNILN